MICYYMADEDDYAEVFEQMRQDEGEQPDQQDCWDDLDQSDCWRDPDPDPDEDN